MRMPLRCGALALVTVDAPASERKIMKAGVSRAITVFSICSAGIGGCSPSQDGAFEEHAEKAAAALQAVDNTLVDAPDSEYGDAPGGRRLHRSCMHEIPQGGSLDGANSRITDANGNVVEQYTKCKYKQHSSVVPGRSGISPVPDTALYQEYSGADATSVVCGNWGPPFWADRYCPAWYNSFSGTVHVPADPTDVGQLIYLWSGIAATTNLPAGAMFNPLLQPVLQWGNNGFPNGGGAFWTFSSWYIDAFGNAIKSLPQTIAAGDDLAMNTFVTDNTCSMSGSGCNWRAVGWRISNSNIFAALVMTGLQGTFNTTYRAVLEAYDSTHSLTGNPACNIYPRNGGTGTTFWNTQAFQPFQYPTDYTHLNQSWLAVTHSPTPNCSYGQTVGNQTDTFLYFNFR